MLFSSACLRLLMFSVCGPRKSTTSSVSRDLSFSSAVCAPVLTPFVCSCSCAIRVCCASTQAANARLVFPPNTPSSVTPITACPSLILMRSLLCSLFVVTTMLSSSATICASIDSTVLLSSCRSLIRCSYSFACVLMRTKSASN